MHNSMYLVHSTIPIQDKSSKLVALRVQASASRVQALASRVQALANYIAIQTAIETTLIHWNLTDFGVYSVTSV